jgi:hypothetical protein
VKPPVVLPRLEADSLAQELGSAGLSRTQDLAAGTEVDFGNRRCRLAAETGGTGVAEA